MVLMEKKGRNSDRRMGNKDDVDDFFSMDSMDFFDGALNPPPLVDVTIDFNGRGLMFPNPFAEVLS